MKAVGNDTIQLKGNRIVPRQQGENRDYAQAVSGQGQDRGVVVEEAAQVATLVVVKGTVVAETLAHRSIAGLGMSEVGIRMWRAITT